MNRTIAKQIDHWIHLVYSLLNPMQTEYIQDPPALQVLDDHMSIMTSFDHHNTPRKIDLIGNLARHWLIKNSLIQDHFADIREYDSLKKGSPQLRQLATLGLQSVNESLWSNPFAPQMHAIYHKLHLRENYDEESLLSLLHIWYDLFHGNIAKIYISGSDHRDDFLLASLQYNAVWASLLKEYRRLSDPSIWRLRSLAKSDIAHRLSFLVNEYIGENLRDLSPEYRLDVWKFVFVANHFLCLTDSDIHKLLMADYQASQLPD